MSCKLSHWPWNWQSHFWFPQSPLSITFIWSWEIQFAFLYVLRCKTNFLVWLSDLFIVKANFPNSHFYFVKIKFGREREWDEICRWDFYYCYCFIIIILLLILLNMWLLIMYFTKKFRNGRYSLKKISIFLE